MPYAGLPDDADVSAISNAGYVGLPADAIATPLSRKEQLAKGAPMSSGEASDYMAQRAAFAKEGGVKMFAKAPPTDTRKISYTDTGYKPNKPAKSIKEFAKNAVQDVVELPMFPVRMAADIANAPDTVEAVKDAAKGLVTTPLGFVPYVSEMATGRTAAENWSTNPGIGALTVLGGGELARRAAPHVADFAIDGARKAAEVTGVPKVMDAAANKLYDMTLKQGTTLKPEIRAQNLETGLDGQYLPNSKGVDKLNADIHAKEQQLGSGIAAGEASNVTGTLDRAIANVSELREQAKRSADPERNLSLIDAEIDRLKGNPLQAPSGEIPISALQKMKVEQGQHVRYQKKNNQAVDPFQATIDKARIRGLRQELEVRLADAFPELADTNKQLGRMYDFQDVLERAASRIENNQGIGIGLPIKGGSGGVMGGMIGGPTGAAIGSGIGTLIGVIEHPAVAPRIALALRRAVKGLSKEDAGNIVNNRLNDLKGGLVQREQTVLDSESLPKVSNSTLGDAIDPAAYQQTYDWSGKPPAPPEVANPEALPPRQIATNLGDELRPNDYAPVHGWEGKAPEQVIANPEALPPRQSSQMPQLSEQGGRVVPHVEAMTPRVPEGFNPEVIGMGTEDVQLGDRLAPKPRPLRNMPESLENTDAQNGPVAGLSEAVDTQVSPFRSVLDELNSKTAIEKGKSSKGHWSVSDFQEYLKQVYPSVAGMEKGRVLSALEAETAGRKLTPGQEQVIDAFRYDLEGHRQKYGDLSTHADNVLDIVDDYIAGEENMSALEFFDAIIAENERRGIHAEPIDQAAFDELFGEVPAAGTEYDSPQSKGSLDGAQEVTPPHRAQLAEVQKYKYKTKSLQHLLEDEDGIASFDDGFHKELLKYAYAPAKAFNEIMERYQGKPVGVEFKTKDGRYAFVTPEMSGKGEWRVQYFDDNGFSSHAEHATLPEAVEEMVKDGYREEAKGALDELSATKKFQQGNAVTALMGKVNSGAMSWDEFIKARDAIYNDGPDPLGIRKEKK